MNFVATSVCRAYTIRYVAASFPKINDQPQSAPLEGTTAFCFDIEPGFPLD